LLDWVVGMMERTGHFGVAARMFAEDLFPPMPSEPAMPLASFLSAKGTLDLKFLVVGKAAVALFWYYGRVQAEFETQ
jgi:membrane protein DedA with SNARE-associated domain